NAFSVRMELSGTATRNSTENYAPYSLFGDRPGNDYIGAAFEPGTYAITATAYSGYGLSGNLVETGTISFELIQNSSINLSAKSSNIMQLSPNPATKRFTIAGFENEIELSNIKVFDSTGKLLKTYNTKQFINNKNFSLNFDNFFPGIYFINAVDSNGNIFQKQLVIPAQ
uniref:T9SS type A sorting domain-containing protein n=1 Tax=uncultured Zobellia sp. TaxID=255433 RepID=UPI002595DFB8